MNNTSAFLALLYEVGVAGRRQASLLLNQLNKKGYQPDEPTTLRMKKGIAIAAVTNLWFSTLRAFPLSENERHCGILLGAVTPVYDDLMDDYGYTHAEIMGGIYNGNPESSKLISLASYLIPESFAHIIQKEAYEHYFQLTVSGQAQSSRQLTGEKLSEAQLEEVMGQKGGNATLLYRHLLANPMIEGEEKAIFLLGKLMQFINDLFDTRSDFLAGNLTLPTYYPTPEPLRAMFDSLVSDTMRAFLSLSYKPKHIRGMLRLIMPVVARGQVCLLQFEQLYRSQGHFRLAEFSRQQLVCDMEKASNLWANYREADKLFRFQLRKLERMV